MQKIQPEKLKGRESREKTRGKGREEACSEDEDVDVPGRWDKGSLEPWLLQGHAHRHHPPSTPDGALARSAHHVTLKPRHWPFSNTRSDKNSLKDRISPS